MICGDSMMARKEMKHKNENRKTDQQRKMKKEEEEMTPELIIMLTNHDITVGKEMGLQRRRASEGRDEASGGKDERSRKRNVYGSSDLHRGRVPGKRKTCL